MDNLYVALYTFESQKNYQHNKNKVSSNNKENFKNQILQAFLKNPNFNNFNGISEFNIKEFFLIDYHDILHCIIIGTQILVPGWSLKIKKILECYIKKKIYLPDQFEFYLRDYTYWSWNADIKPRRLRSLGGALRRIISLHKNIYYENFDNEENKNIQLYTVFGNNKKLQATYLGVSQNKKIIENKKENYHFNENDKIFNFPYENLYQIKKNKYLTELNNEKVSEIYKEVDDKIDILANWDKENVITFLNNKLFSIKN